MCELLDYSQPIKDLPAQKPGKLGPCHLGSLQLGELPWLGLCCLSVSRVKKEDSWFGSVTQREGMNLMHPSAPREGRMLSAECGSINAGKQVRLLWVLTEIYFHPDAEQMGRNVVALMRGAAVWLVVRPFKGGAGSSES